MCVRTGRARLCALALCITCLLVGALPGSASAVAATAACLPSPGSAAERLERSAGKYRREARRLARRAATHRRIALHARARRLTRSSRRRAKRARALRERARVCATAAARRAPRKPTADRTAPTVSFSQPVAGATVAGLIGGTACEATASDGSGVAAVEFSVDGAPLGSEGEAPYS